MTANANIELDEEILFAHDAQLLARLATMSAAEYGKQRDAIAEELGIRVTFLDAEWKERRKAKRGASEQTSELFPTDEPWEHPVNGAGLLSMVRKRLVRHVSFANEEQAVAAVLWAAFAWTHEAHTHSPILLVTSAERDCGKTTLLALVRFLTPRPLFTAEISPAALYRSIEKWRPTIVLDEADKIFLANDELRAVVNTGWTRGSGIIRCHPETNEPMQFPTFCPKAIGMKGKKLPDTTLSRCIVLELKRKLPSEDVQGFDHQDNGELVTLRRMLARWAHDHMDELKGAEPVAPEGFDNRLADNWRPLLAIADLAGAEWPELARKAAVRLSPLDQSSVGTMLLADIKATFEEAGRDRLSSDEIVEALHGLEGRPWAEWGKASRPLTKNQLAGLLRDFRVFPVNVRVGSKVPKGYLLSAFNEVFGRYLTPSLTPSPPSEPLQRYNADGIRTSGAFQNATRAANEADVADRECKKSLRRNGCGVVADRKSLGGGERGVCAHCGRPGGELLQVAVPDGPLEGVPVHRCCVDAWYASGASLAIPDEAAGREAAE
jgi:putative DNA primase/helicase